MSKKPLPFTNGPTLQVNGQPYSDHLRSQLERECRTWGIPMPDDKQIGAVLHAMADHTAIMQMTRFDRRALYPHGDQEDKFWPTETSIGRFFHAAGDAFGGPGMTTPDNPCASGIHTSRSDRCDYCGKPVDTSRQDDRDVIAGVRLIANTDTPGTWTDPATGKKLYNEAALEHDKAKLEGGKQ